MPNTEKTYLHLGEKLLALRREQKLTQNALADGIVTRNMLSRIENGAATPSLSVICALADRLDVPVGYLIDDRDDGNAARNRRLLDMILSEFEAEHYDLCLTYCDAIGDYEEIVSSVREISRFRLAVQKMENGRLKEAQKAFAAMAKENALPPEQINECHLYRCLLSGFLSEPEQGKEEDYLRSLASVATAPHDLVTLSAVLTLIERGDPATAEAVLSLSAFKEPSYAALCRGRIFCFRGDYHNAMKQFIEAAGYHLLPPIECYCLTLLEKCAAALQDFERAYAYMEKRRALSAILTKKTDFF
ncbi:MAG: helix-turn-helix transcriptional regulator [Clostridia bacterium]|nr:helix-turn-helix transcriptional regulator [Clostridia bacterium]